MPMRKVIFDSDDEPGQKKILHDTIEAFKERIGKKDIPVAIVRPYCPRGIGGIPADELEQISGPLEIDFPDSEEGGQDSKKTWQRSLPCANDVRSTMDE